MTRKISQKRPRSNLLWYRGKLIRRDGVVLIRWTDTHHGIELLEARDSGEKRLHYVTPDGGYFTDEESAVARCLEVESGTSPAAFPSRPRLNHSSGSPVENVAAGVIDHMKARPRPKG